MPEMTWDRLEHPILAEIAELTKRGQRGPGASEIVRATGLDDTDVRVALSRLYDSQYVTGTRLRNAGYGQGFQNLHLTERGLRAAGVWPNDDPFASLVAALQSADRSGAGRRAQGQAATAPRGRGRGGSGRYRGRPDDGAVRDGAALDDAKVCVRAVARTPLHLRLRGPHVDFSRGNSVCSHSQLLSQTHSLPSG